MILRQFSIPVLYIAVHVILICLSLKNPPSSQSRVGNFSRSCRRLAKSTTQINALLIVVPGLFKYHQTQSPKGSSLNPGCSAFQSKCLDYHSLFVCLFKNVLKAQFPKSEKLLQRGDVYAVLHSALWQEKRWRSREDTGKLFKASSYFSLEHMAWESNRVFMEHF